MESLFVAFVIIFGVEVLFGILMNLFNFLIVKRNYDKSDEMKKQLQNYIDIAERKEKYLYELIKEVEKLKEKEQVKNKKV